MPKRVTDYMLYEIDELKGEVGYLKERGFRMSHGTHHSSAQRTHQELEDEDCFTEKDRAETGLIHRERMSKW